MRRSDAGVTLVAVVLVLATTSSAGGATPPAQPSVDDAQTAMRVRTALVNDELLGPERILVDVDEGQVQLSGLVSDPALVERAEALVRQVDGVRSVTTSLDTGAVEPIGRDRPGRLPSIPPPIDDNAPRRVLALGVGGAFATSPDNAVGSGLGFGPHIRLAPRNGWGPSLGFSWTRRPLERSPIGGDPLAKLNIRPIMAGVEYGVVRGRVTAGLSIVGGYAFTSLSLDTTQTGPGRAIGVDNTPVVRVGASLWTDVTSRVSVGVFGGYLVARPRVTFANESTIEKSRLTADAVLFSVGVSYWVF